MLPVAFQDFYNFVALFSHSLQLSCTRVNIGHQSSLQMSIGLKMVWVTCGATVPKAALDLEDHICELITIHSVKAVQDAVFTMVGPTCKSLQTGDVDCLGAQQTVFPTM